MAVSQSIRRLIPENQLNRMNTSSFDDSVNALCTCAQCKLQLNWTLEVVQWKTTFNHTSNKRQSEMLEFTLYISHWTDFDESLIFSQSHLMWISDGWMWARLCARATAFSRWKCIFLLQINTAHMQRTMCRRWCTSPPLRLNRKREMLQFFYQIIIDRCW